MLIGGIIITCFGGLTYIVDKTIYECTDKYIINAPRIDQANPNGYGYIQGNIKSTGPLEFNGQKYIRIDEYTYQISKQRKIQRKTQEGCNTIIEKDAKIFTYKILRIVNDITINNVDIKEYIKDIDKTVIEHNDVPINQYVQNDKTTTSIVTNTEVEDKDYTMYPTVYRIEHRYEGIKMNKQITIFGIYKNGKMYRTQTRPNIVTEHTREEYIEQIKNKHRRWQMVWITSTMIGCVMCIGSMITK